MIASMRQSAVANRSINVIFIAFIFEGWTWDVLDPVEQSDLQLAQVNQPLL